MSQKTESTQQEPSTSNPSVQHRVVQDALSQEELRDVCLQNSSSERVAEKGDTSFFQQGMAAAFAEEEQKPLYEEPPLLSKIRVFFAEYDFDDRSDKSKGFAIVSQVHADINSCKILLESMALSLQGQQVPRKIREDLYHLSLFEAQASSYLLETKPTF